MANGLNRAQVLAKERAAKAAQEARDRGKPAEETEQRLNPKWPYRMIAFDPDIVAEG